MIIFDGDARAAELEAETKQRVYALAEQGRHLKIAAILFEEDKGSQLYTRLKSEAAQRAGIAYEVHTFSLRDGVEAVVQTLDELNADETVTGIIIQKPWRKTWAEAKGIAQDSTPKAVRQAFNSWWHYLVERIDLSKDVDGLHPQTLSAVENGNWQEKGLVLPATAGAILDILKSAWTELNIDENQAKKDKIMVIGRSDIVGLPVFYELKNQGFDVQLLTRDDFAQRKESGRGLKDAKVVVSATGVQHLITGDLLTDESIVIDAGEPRPDVEFESVKDGVDFITPVPGGVGPMTVSFLLGNAVALVDID